MKITLVTGSDWQGIYVDGVLKDEGHLLAPWMILEALGVPFTEVGADEEWLEDEGSLPFALKDVQVRGGRMAA